MCMQEWRPTSRRGVANCHRFCLNFYTDERTLLQSDHDISAGSKLLRWAKAKRGQAGEDNAVIRIWDVQIEFPLY